MCLATFATKTPTQWTHRVLTMFRQYPHLARASNAALLLGEPNAHGTATEELTTQAHSRYSYHRVHNPTHSAENASFIICPHRTSPSTERVPIGGWGGRERAAPPRRIQYRPSQVSADGLKVPGNLEMAQSPGTFEAPAVGIGSLDTQQTEISR
ncbi:hypothetical protein BJY00DRAFT_295108 [Aspergillus carlsbadensis]|nr:hypothetical protein BJY00DRAFT_295108 [Aspergillus carlsbadensis]